MRVLRYVGIALVAALAVTGIAVAESNSGGAKTEAAVATFNAHTASDHTRTCQGADGTYHFTEAVYRGTSTGDPRLTGEITIRTKSIVNLTSGLGTTSGQLQLKNGGRTVATAQVEAVNTQRGKLDGFLAGHAGRGQSGARLFANFSAAFNADGSQLSGELGADAPVPPTNSAVLQSGRCGQPLQQQQSGGAPGNGQPGQNGKGHGRKHGQKQG